MRGFFFNFALLYAIQAKFAFMLLFCLKKNQTFIKYFQGDLISTSVHITLSRLLNFICKLIKNNFINLLAVCCQNYFV